MIIRLDRKCMAFYLPQFALSIAVGANSELSRKSLRAHKKCPQLALDNGNLRRLPSRPAIRDRSHRNAPIGSDPKIKCAVNSSQPPKNLYKFRQKTLHSRLLRYIFIPRDFPIFEPAARALRRARHTQGTERDVSSTETPVSVDHYNTEVIQL